MERVIYEDDFGNIACNGIIIYSNSNANLERDISDFSKSNWINFKPKYYTDKSDNMMFEIWYDRTGIILDRGLNKHLKNGEFSKDWGIKSFKEITYEEAMNLLENKSTISYSNKDLMSRVEDGLEKENEEPRFDITKAIKESKGNFCCEIGIDYARDDMVDAMSYAFTLAKSGAKQNNNGGATDYYVLPDNANTLQDLIEHRNMNGSVKDIFKACYRLGIKTEDELRDLNKMAYYSLREIGRITSRKDYITIAKELIGSQAIEKE